MRDFNDNNSIAKSMVAIMIFILAIATLFPMMNTIQKFQNDEILTEYVYIPVEVNNDSNITLSSNFVNQIDVKEEYIINSNISESYSELNQSSILQFDTYSNISADINFTISNISVNGFTNYTIDSYQLNQDVFNGIKTSDNTYYCNDVIFLYQSFTITESLILDNISIHIRAGGDDYTTNFAIHENNAGIVGSEIEVLTVQYSGLASESKIIDLNGQNISLEAGSYFLKMSANNLLRVFYNTTINNEVSYKDSVLSNLDFAINYSFLQYSYSVIDNISINNVIYESNSSNIYSITDFLISGSEIEFNVNCNWTNVTYDLVLFIDLFSDTLIRSIDNISISQILLISNASKLAVFSSNNTNISIFTIFNQKISSILLFSSATNRYIQVLLPSNITIEVEANYDFIIKDIEVFVDSFKLQLDVYQNNVLKNSYNATNAVFYPIYSF